SVADTGRGKLTRATPLRSRWRPLDPFGAAQVLTDPAHELREGEDDHDRDRKPAEHDVRELVVRVRNPVDVLVLDVDQRPDRDDEDRQLPYLLAPADELVLSRS